MAMLTFTPRDHAEAHRAATTLELLFDLASVIAIASAAIGLHHGIAEGHALEVLPSFMAAFFMIWWSWMNYTWFASAYDDGSPAFVALSFVAMFGALMIAAGIPAVFAGDPIYLSLAGFVVMRVAMALFWFGAASGDRSHRKTALSYGFGILLLQCFWVWLVFSVPPGSALYSTLFVVGVLGELAVPAYSEGRHGVTTWHRHHIIERYGLLNIIVLGECFLAIAAMLATGESGAPAPNHAILTAISAAAVTFSLWGIYFTSEDHLIDSDLRRALPWGYGHLIVFAAGAATGAGFAVFHEVATAHAEIGLEAASMAIAIPVAIYLLALWVIRDRFYFTGWRGLVLPTGAALAIAAPLLFGEALFEIALVSMATAALRRAPLITKRAA